MASNTTPKFIMPSLANFQNLETGDFIFRGEKLKNSSKYYPLIANLCYGTVFDINETELGITISNNDFLLDMSRKKKDNCIASMWRLNSTLKDQYHQHWELEQPDYGLFILVNKNHCLKHTKDVLVQDGKEFRCVPWDTIKNDPEKKKFAYWRIIV